MRSGGRETEIKLALPDAAAVRRRLRQWGFRVSQPRGLEENILFDTPGRALRRNGCMIRLRGVRGRYWLTFKGPAGKGRRYKMRAEAETELSQPRAARRILAGLGFKPVFCYQKYRTVYLGPQRWSGGEVMVDETPIGDFLELEGGPAWIRRLARALGASPEEFITQDYAALYTDWCRRRGRPVGQMVFSAPTPAFALTKERRKRI